MSVLKLVRHSLPSLGYIRQPATVETSNKSPCTGGVFCSGYMSSMMGAKACNVEEYFVKKGLGFVRFDYTDVGVSMDPKLSPKYSFKQWKDDVSTVLDQLTEGPQILIGSSMGAWMSLLNCLEKPERVAGLLLIAPSVDFFKRFRHVIPKEMNERFENGEILYIDGPYGQYPVHKRFFNESLPFELLNKEKIDIDRPVRIFHSISDIFAPFDVSLQLMKKISSPDIELHLVKSSDHRMSSDSDMDSIKILLDSLFISIDKNV